MKIEINMIVRSAREAADFYKNLFGAEVRSKTNSAQGTNETKMVIADTLFRILDENPALGMIAPAEGVPASIGVNLFVEDIQALAQTAENMGCETLSPVTDFGHAMNTVFKDIFGHLWVINQDMDKLTR